MTFLRLNRSFATIACAAALLGALPACSSTVQMTRTSLVPAADGTVDVGKDDNGNNMVTVKVTRLATPDRIDDDLTVFLVWAIDEDDDEKVRLLGKMNVDDDGEGTFTATVPFKEFRVLVTGEASEDVKVPSSNLVLGAEDLEAN